MCMAGMTLVPLPKHCNSSALCQAACNVTIKDKIHIKATQQLPAVTNMTQYVMCKYLTNGTVEIIFTYLSEF